jgi:cytochrome c-type biogenesis protein CcmF
LLAWRKGADAVFFSTLLKPFIAGIIGALVYVFVYSQIFSRDAYSYGDVLGEVYSVITVGLGIFVIAGIFQEYYRGIRARREADPSENYFLAAWLLLTKNKRRYGGYLVHLSLVLIFIGYAGNAFKQNTSIRFMYELLPPKDNEVVYASQDKGILGNYQIEASTLKIKPLPFRGENNDFQIQNTIVSQEASYKISIGTEFETDLVTERRFYPQISHLSGGFETHIPTSEPAILSRTKEDLYIQLGAIEKVDLSSENPDLPLMYMDYLFAAQDMEQRLAFFSRFPRQIVANLEIWVNPLVKFVWIGSLMYFLSGLFILLPIGEKKKD